MKTIHNRITGKVRSRIEFNRMVQSIGGFAPHNYTIGKSFKETNAVKLYCKFYNEYKGCGFTFLKTLFTMVLMLSISCATQAQSISFKKVLIKSGVLYASGLLQGSHEANLHHYDRFDRVHSIANDQWFNPRYSDTNKYKPGTTEPRFFGSTSFLVGFTDYYHSSKQLWIGGTMLGCTITIFDGKPNFKQKALELLGSLIVHKLGFITSYNLIYHS